MHHATQLKSFSGYSINNAYIKPSCIKNINPKIRAKTQSSVKKQTVCWEIYNYKPLKNLICM